MGPRRLLVAVALTACSDDEVLREEPVGEPPGLVEGANEVRLHVFGDPLLIAYRNGTSGWGTPEKIAAGEYRLRVDTTYEVVIACGEWPLFDSELHARAYADGDTDVMICYSFDFESTNQPTPALHELAMPVLQPAHVWLYGDQAGTSADWTFTQDVPSGTYDMIAVDESHRIAIRRGLEVDGPRTLDALDFDVDGTPMLEHPFKVFGEGAAETVTATVSLFTQRQFATVPGDDDTLYLPPPAILQGNEFGRIRIEVTDEGVERSISAGLNTPRHDFQVMPIIEPNAFVYSVPDNQTLRGDWSKLPEFDELSVELWGQLTSQRATFTRRFLDTVGTRRFQMTTPPHFQPEWRVDLRHRYLRDISLSWTNEGIVYRTRRVDEVTNVLGNE